MKARELAEQILRRIEEGTLDPEAVIVRSFCLCDDDFGFVEASFLDQVVRRYEESSQPTERAANDEDNTETRIFRKGSVNEGPLTATTVSLG